MFYAPWSFPPSFRHLSWPDGTRKLGYPLGGVGSKTQEKKSGKKKEDGGGQPERRYLWGRWLYGLGRPLLWTDPRSSWQRIRVTWRGQVRWEASESASWLRELRLASLFEAPESLPNCHRTANFDVWYSLMLDGHWSGNAAVGRTGYAKWLHPADLFLRIWDRPRINNDEPLQSLGGAVSYVFTSPRFIASISPLVTSHFWCIST